MTNIEKFRQLGLSDVTLEAIKRKGFEEPTDIQALTIPLLLANEQDIIGQAQTGTGKTAAFGLPIIERLTPRKKYPQALILTPTRELTIQVAEELNTLKGKNKLSIVPIYGGQSYSKQLQQLAKNVDIIVGTPGRIIDHLSNKKMDLSQIKYFILDEADEMLNMGFIEDLSTIFKLTNSEKRTLMFSATMPNHIQKLAKKFMKNPKTVKTEVQQLTVNLTDQIYFEVRESDKLEALCRIMDVEDEFYGIIFCRTKRDVDDITEKLLERSYDVEALHGDISQYLRERILKKFRMQSCTVLIATDVAARGLDITNLSHVINYSLPQDSESYIHRIGRTGRAGKSGTAITFITPSEYRKLINIQKASQSKIRKETVPTIKAIIDAKKAKIKTDISEMLRETPEEEYRLLAQGLLDNNDPTDVLAAAIKYGFEDQLNEEAYSEIKEITHAPVDKQGRTRLFVAKGKKDNMNPRKLVAYIEKQSRVFGKRIDGVQVFDTFSFITVSFQDAERILEAFRPQGNRRSTVEKASENKGKKQVKKRK